MINHNSETHTRYKERKAPTISRNLILLVDVLVGAIAAAGSLFGFYKVTGLVESTPQLLATVTVAGLLATLLSSCLLGTYRPLLRYQYFSIGRRLLVMFFLNTLMFYGILLAGNYWIPLGYGGNMLLMITITYFATFFVLFILYRSVAVISARAFWGVSARKNKRERVLIYGVSDASSNLAMRLEESPKYKVVGICNNSCDKGRATVSSFNIYHVEEGKQIKHLVKKLNIDAIIFTDRSDLLKERETIIYELSAIGVKSLLAPEISETSPTDLARDSVQKIEMEDLLKREVIHHEPEKVKEMYRDKVVMVTGAAGSIGSELVMQIAQLPIKQLLLLDIAETPLHNVRLKLKEKYPDLNFVPILGDIRSQNRLDALFAKYRPNILLHAAAYKHVPLLEENPCEGVLVNVQGSKNIADFCLKYEVERMVMVSTDKAVNPTNVLGATKRAAEIYVQALGKAVEEGKVAGKTTFITTRFGNVLGSQGSVIPLFRDQIAKGGPVTVTDPNINRFFMSIHEACSLILEASSVAKETTIFVFDMGEPHKIVDLAENMVRLAGMEPYRDIDIKFTGLRPGEKLYEEKLADGENTIPTNIPKIHIAKVREHNYADLYETYEALRDTARKIEIEPCVALLKGLIPEYISAPNSPYAPLDKK